MLTDKLMLVLTDLLKKMFLWYVCDILYLIILAIQNIYIMLLAVLEVLSNMHSNTAMTFMKNYEK